MLNKIFHLKERNTNVRTEIIAGLVTFAAMCYILPINTAILSDMGMNSSGVFMMTALLTFIVSMIMGLVANYPIVLSSGMGLNAFLVYTIVLGNDSWTWREGMILLTICGIIFFILSITPVRKWLIEAIPKNIRYIIAAALGIFICFVGLKNSGIIVADGSTLVAMNTFLDPGVICGIVGILVCLGLMFSKSKMVKNLAIPMTIIGIALVGLIISTCMIRAGTIINVDGSWVYSGYVRSLEGVSTTLPIWPGFDSSIKWADFSGMGEVFLYGVFASDAADFSFGSSLVTVLTNPVSYVAMFSLIFVNLFDTTATVLAVGKDTGLISQEGKVQNYQRAVLADATGALICGPMGTSTVTSFAESNVGVSMGARTGLSACSAALCFLLCMFIYPIFSVFTAGSVTAAALVSVGAMIFVNNLKDVEWNDAIVGFTAFITLIFTVLTYSISTGIGMGLISYCVMCLFARKGKEVGVAIYVISALFLLSFILTGVLELL